MLSGFANALWLKHGALLDVMHQSAVSTIKETLGESAYALGTFFRKSLGFAELIKKAFVRFMN